MSVYRYRIWEGRSVKALNIADVGCLMELICNMVQNIVILFNINRSFLLNMYITLLSNDKTLNFNNSVQQDVLSSWLKLRRDER